MTDPTNEDGHGATARITRHVGAALRRLNDRPSETVTTERDR